MRMFDLISKKKHGEALSEAEIKWWIESYVSGAVPDYQVSALLMAIYFEGMSDSETAALTMAVARSGDMIDLSAIHGATVDKHSTGGVGDKTTLIIAPIAAACGVKVAKMSGRGLGHTGGTVDKLEAIPGLHIALSQEDFFAQVNDTGLAVIGQSGQLAPADKKLYALRDVTATVDSIPLIAASIMSKKLASGSSCIVLDVKTGSGAFMKTIEDSILLAQKMVAIGEENGRKTSALITDMDRPLGFAIGNSLEVIESIETLKGHGPADLTEVSLKLAAEMLYLAGKGEIETCLEMAKQTLNDGSALERLRAMIAAQGGDADVIDDYKRFKQAEHKFECIAKQDGYISRMDTEGIGIASSLLGAGRATIEDAIDYSAGIVLHKKTGDAVKTGEVLAEFYADDTALFATAAERFAAALQFSEAEPEAEKLIYARISKDAVERY